MNNINRKLALIALTAALASPLAFAQSTDASAAPAQATDATGTAPATQPAAQPGAQPAATPAQSATEMASTGKPQRKTWESIDIDGDGKISAVEAQSDAALLKQFPTIDTDKDGFVSVAEYKAHVAAKSGKKASSQG
jgi:EF hand